MRFLNWLVSFVRTPKKVKIQNSKKGQTAPKPPRYFRPEVIQLDERRG